MFRWEVTSFEVSEATDTGTGEWEPFGYDSKQRMVLAKRFVEVETELMQGKATEVHGSLKEWTPEKHTGREHLK